MAGMCLGFGGRGAPGLVLPARPAEPVAAGSDADSLCPIQRPDVLHLAVIQA